MPISFESKLTVASKAQPGVSFLIRRLNRIERAKRDFKVQVHVTRLHELVAKMRADNAASSLGVEVEYLLDALIVPNTLAAGLVEVNGLLIDGQPATVESFIAHGPTDLITEAYEACVEASGLNGGEQKNSQSPGDSPRQVDGEAITTTATTASA